MQLSSFHCAKMAEQIKVLFGVNTPGGPWNILLDVGLDIPQRGEWAQFKFWHPLLYPEHLKLET